jgi:hypothetical protein
MPVIPYLACMLSVASAAHLPPRVLPVIAAIEGGVVGGIRPDRNGTADLGVMQINTIWVPALAAQARMSNAATRGALIDDPCFNIAAAALILRVYLRQNGGGLLPAIGDYHSHTPPLNQAYIAQAELAAQKMFEQAPR